jgi:hypothetical protein
MERPNRLHPPPVVAVDAGVISLGDLAKGGTVFAVRGSACLYTPEGEVIVLRYNTGAIAIDNENKLKVLHFVGKVLDDEQFFVKVLSEPPYFQEKQGVLSTSNQVQDRIRNFVERVIQAEAVSILSNYGGGILLIDGALPARTFDTPPKYISDMLDFCNKNRIDVAAISKKTRITVKGIPIQNLFDEKYGSDFVGYVALKNIVEHERRSDKKSGINVRIKITVAKEMFAARFGFGELSLTFRVDVNNCRGKTAEQVINDIYNYCFIYGGYPKPLIEAHQNSCFLFQDFQSLVAQATVYLGAKPQEQPTMETIFQPFGAFGK